MSEVVDVREAEATVEADREKIMSKLGKNCIELNRMVRATCLGVKSAIKCPQIVSAACGDLDVDSVQEFLRTNPSQAFYVAAGGGFLNVVKYLYVVCVCVYMCGVPEYTKTYPSVVNHKNINHKK